MKLVAEAFLVLFFLVCLVPSSVFATTQQCVNEDDTANAVLFVDKEMNKPIEITLTAINPIYQVDEKRGCCSHHGGVAYCGSSGYWICNDGTRSPTCRCD
ncbi:hypothetical protein [Pelobacter seleniigenes]|uniref:hypothetical protein n=1 Tax=Pelobacter seleniigenes TaxID=407188 RepID=UPI0004A6CE08|nr:hypothetical protein [Pelobacter seleniigenes]